MSALNTPQGLEALQRLKGTFSLCGNDTQLTGYSIFTAGIFKHKGCSWWPRTWELSVADAKFRW